MGNPISHGQVSDGYTGFVRLLDAQPIQPSIEALQALAIVMVDELDVPSDNPDPEENLMIPAGYTYFGQFIDHDLTFDIGTSFQDNDPTNFRNARSPRFDLDNIYGPGPDAAPFMYEVDGVHLRTGSNDLPRIVVGHDAAQNDVFGRAIIGDPRNDENSIVCNLQMRFIAFHNAVADKLSSRDPTLSSNTSAWFKRAQQEVRWTYQVIVTRDFLKRIVRASVLSDFDGVRQPDAKDLTTRDEAFRLYPPAKRSAIPLEFSGAAYRYGHSAIRFGYRLSDATILPIFNTAVGNAANQNNPAFSLVGFGPLPLSHVILNWERFFPSPASGHACVVPGVADPAIIPADGGADAARLQFSYRIDTTISDPLSNLPPSVAGIGPVSLAERNLRRGSVYQLPTGQQVAAAIGKTPLLAGSIRVRAKLRREDTDPINGSWIESFLTPQQVFDKLRASGNPAAQVFTGDLDQFLTSTPLWMYVLAEAQQNIVNWWLARGTGSVEFSEDELLRSGDATVTQLGDVGGRIVAEVFHGLLDADPDSYRNAEGGQSWLQGGHLIQDFTMWHLVTTNLKP